MLTLNTCGWFLFKTLTTTNSVLLLYQYITQTGLLYYLLPLLLLVFDWFSVHVLLWTINQCSSHCHTHLWLLLLVVISSSSTSSSPSFRPTPTTRTVMVGYLVVPHSTAHTSWLSWSMGIDLCDATDSFRTTLSEDHLGSHVEELRTLDEAEPARGLVTSSEVLSVHA